MSATQVKVWVSNADTKIIADPSGHVLRHCFKGTWYPVKFDLEDWRARHPGHDPASETLDFLDLGVWDNNGIYMPPA